MSTLGAFFGRLVATRLRIILLSSGIGLPVASVAGVELTSGPAFCNSCHEISPAVESWKRGPHAPKDGKERADCRGCHVPSWRNPVAVLAVKAYHGVKDVYHHYASEEARKSPDFYFRLKAQALTQVDDRVCLSCHEEILGAKDIFKIEGGVVVKGLHSSAEAKKLRCAVCHKNTGHGPFE